eukprot:8815248-Pyramimonas_sp.AAC.1
MGHGTADYQCADPLAERVYQPSRRKLVIDHDVSSTINQIVVTLLAHVHRCGSLPAQAFTSQAVAIGKIGKSQTGN